MWRLIYERAEMGVLSIRCFQRVASQAKLRCYRIYHARYENHFKLKVFYCSAHSNLDGRGGLNLRHDPTPPASCHR